MSESVLAAIRQQAEANYTQIRNQEPVLAEAERIIHGQRNDDYGKAEDSFRIIAGFWDDYLSNQCCTGTKFDGLSAIDVAHMMILLKIARVTTSHGSRDSYVDIAGYAALATEIGGFENA